ncbi:response regulator transcription factor [Methylococcus mesophilus]|uniref:response regulator transcription factor n=1 Tax=Methylococcus mesophilus TaxID=2993564 RepID=UPI00224B5C57|nr:response regulator [Methylococcus mesophilus]UZR28865.1 response regulator [Methylococcus mesophilus]
MKFSLLFHTMKKANPDLIAIVDDEEAVCKALRRLMRSAGFAVETFGSAAAFLESLGKQVPLCVILDLHMPGLTGFDVLDRLKAKGMRIPTIVVTGHDTEEAQSRVLATGAAYLRKPVDDRALLDTIASLQGSCPHLLPPDINE